MTKILLQAAQQSPTEADKTVWPERLKAAQRACLGYLDVAIDQRRGPDRCWVATLWTPGWRHVRVSAHSSNKRAAIKALDKTVAKLAIAVVSVDYDLQD